MEWSYSGNTGPEHWVNLSDDFCMCNGQMQSPIDIVDVKEDGSLCPINFHYSATHFSAKQTPNGYAFHSEQENYIVLQEKRYELVQFHFHARSEHSYEGVFFPIEAHLVHKDHNDKLLVVGVMLEAGTGNIQLHDIIAYYRDASRHAFFEFPLSFFLPQTRDYFTYIGSLTTPPCSEQVAWYLLQHTFQIEGQELRELAQVLNNNFRPIQERNDRPIFSYTS